MICNLSKPLLVSTREDEIFKVDRATEQMETKAGGIEVGPRVLS